MATHSSILAWRIPIDIGAWWVSVHGVAKSWYLPSVSIAAAAKSFQSCPTLYDLTKSCLVLSLPFL